MSQNAGLNQVINGLCLALIKGKCRIKLERVLRKKLTWSHIIALRQTSK